MPSYLDLERWKRRAHFDFYRGFDQPFFNLCAPIEVTGLKAATGGGSGRSFFLACLWLALEAANGIEPFRYRLRGERVVVHEVIHGGATILRDDDTFGFGYFDYHADFARFHGPAAEEVARVKARTGELEPRPQRDDVIHFSAIPWVAFTSFAHARDRGPDNSVPKIVFGKVESDPGGAQRMPVSVEVHHALMDGLDAGRWFQRFAALCAEPPLG